MARLEDKDWMMEEKRVGRAVGRGGKRINRAKAKLCMTLGYRECKNKKVTMLRLVKQSRGKSPADYSSN